MTDGLLLSQVNQAYSDYTFALDGNDPDGLAACFAEDGVWAISGRDPIEGRAAIAAFVEETSGARPRHLYANLGLTSVADDVVRSRAYFFLVAPSSGQIVAHGEYADELAEDPSAGGRLVFTRRDIRFLWMDPSYASRGRAGVDGDDQAS